MVREEVLKEFGEFLVSLRKQKKMSLRQIEIYAKGHGVELTRGTLQHYEKGIIGAIDRERLTAISVVYGRTYEEVVNQYVVARFGVNLLQPSLREELIYPDEEHATLHRKLQMVLDCDDERLSITVGTNIESLYEKLASEQESAKKQAADAAIQKEVAS
jgi:transcriptional regulator with XRE-family HTH domain